MAIRLSHLTSKASLHELGKLLDADNTGQLTPAELKKARDDIAAGTASFTPAQKRALTELEKIMRGERELPSSSAAPRDPTRAASAVRANPTAGADVSGDISRLNDTQRAVLEDVRTKAKQRSKDAHAALIERAKREGFSEADVVKALKYIRDKAPVTINFHPDKQLRQTTATYGASGVALPDYGVAVDRDKSVLIDAFLVDGHYKNQFETGITSGSPSAYPGGSRDNWEKTIFEGGYHGHDLVPAERPKYGAMNAAMYPSGPAQSYGSCFFILKKGARERATFTAGNSSGRRAEHVGTVQDFKHVLKDAQMFKDIMEVALGKKRYSTGGGWGYLEAQVHGPVDFDKDIAQLVIASRFAGTDYEKKLRKLAETKGIDVMWSDGQKIMTDAEWKASRPGGGS